MFRYDVQTPIKILRGHSALVPIVSETLEGEIVAVYNERVRAGNPLTSFKLENTTELTLEGGPATVYRDGEYAGEAMIDTMRPGESRLVPFSVELGCRITTAFDSASEALQEIAAKDGYLYHTTWTRTKTVYTIRNTTAKDLKIYIDHPADRAAEYVDSPKPEEQTESFDRFVVEVAAKKQGTFELVQRRRSVSTIWINPDQIEHHMVLVTKIGNSELMGRMKPLADIGERIARLQEERQKVENDVNEIATQHKRIRENLKPLGLESKRERELRDRYVGSLDSDETRMFDLRKRLDEIDAKMAMLRAQFDAQANELA